MTGNLAALRHVALRAYLAGTLVSNCGTWIQNVALALLAYRLTGGSTLWVGAVGFSQFAAYGVLAPWSGRAADRFDRRRLGLVASFTNAGLALLLAALTATAAVTGTASVALACGVALLSGVTTALATPALKALVIDLVPSADAGRALTLESATYNVARVVGPLLGAAVVAAVGFGWAFVANAVTYLALAVGLRWVPPSRSRPSPSPPEAAAPASLRATIRSVRGQPLLVASLAVVAAVSMAADAVTTLGPELSTEVLGRPDTYAGVLVGAFGAGAVAVVLVVSPALRTSPARLGVRCGAMAAGLVVLAASSHEVLSLLALALAGAGYLACNTEATTTLQLGTAAADRGRVAALWSIAFLGSRPVASIVLGGTATLAGARVAAVVAVVPLAVAVVVLRWAARRARSAAPPPSTATPTGTSSTSSPSCRTPVP